MEVGDMWSFRRSLFAAAEDGRERPGHGPGQGGQHTSDAMGALPLPLTGGDPYKNTNRIAFSIIVIDLPHSRTLYTNEQTSVKKALARQIQTNLNPYVPKVFLFESFT